jgi:hypothetical protein
LRRVAAGRVHAPAPDQRERAEARRVFEAGADASALASELESRGTGDCDETGSPLRAGGWLLKFHESRHLGEKVVPRLPRTM